MFMDKETVARSASTLLVDIGSVGVTGPSSEITILKSQMSQMMEMLNLLAARITTLPGKDASGSTETSTPTVAPAEKSMDQVVCLNCEGVGHYRHVCTSPNSSKLQEASKNPQVKESTGCPTKIIDSKGKDARKPQHKPKLLLFLNSWIF